jgi:small subunit ribosomal protein S6
MQSDTQSAAPTPPAPHAAGIRLREYETIFLVRPDLAEDLVDKTVERLRGVINREGGKVIKVINMGKKKTAFEVKKHPRAIFIQMQYLGDSKMVAEVERNLRMTDDVLKYQTVKLAEDVDPNARQVEADVKLPGDPEVPAHAPAPEREHGFGGHDRDGEGRGVPDELEAEAE